MAIVTRADFEFKNLRSDIQENGDYGVVEGYASVFGNVDSYGTVIAPGAFGKTLADGLSKVKVLWNHDWDNPIGKVLEAREDSNGLFVKCQFSLGVERAKEVFTLIKDAVIDSFSIGFNILEYEIINDQYTINAVELWDVSPVTFPANREAKITACRSIKEHLDEARGDAATGDIVNALKDLNRTLRGSLTNDR